jgi:hypothetical protein
MIDFYPDFSYSLGFCPFNLEDKIDKNLIISLSPHPIALKPF